MKNGPAPARRLVDRAQIERTYPSLDQATISILDAEHLEAECSPYARITAT
jgi:hypothetical protein